MDIDSLPFEGFVNNLERRQAWLETAKLVLARLHTENVGLVADTAAGKTIIALMVILGGDYRTIFATPQKILTVQHWELLKRVLGDNSMAKIITGEIPKKKRDWNGQIIIATPQTVEHDLKAGKLDLRQFQLLIVDEFHRAVGHYSYTEIAQRAHAAGLRILGLTASPAGSPAQVATIQKNLFLDTFLVPDIKAPDKNEDVIIVSPDDMLNEVETHLNLLLYHTAYALFSAGLIAQSPQKILRQTEINELSKKVRQLAADDPLRYQGLSLLARYLKLRHALSLLLTDSYHSFVAYGEELNKDESKAARWIVSHPSFQAALQLAKEERHPKELKFIELVHSLKRAGKNALVFVGTRATGLWLKNQLAADGIRTEFLSGGQDKSIARQKMVLDKLATRTIDVLIATSVVEEGVSIPEVDTVIHYALPQTPIARKQRNGRTGRMKTGHVIFLRMDNALDGALYFGTRRKMEAVQATVKGEVTGPQLKPLPLFPGW